MKNIIFLLTVILNFSTVMAQTSVLDFTVKDRKGNDVALSEYKGKVLLIVNTATRCGFTPQYEELEALYKNYKDKAGRNHNKITDRRVIIIINNCSIYHLYPPNQNPKKSE